MTDLLEPEERERWREAIAAFEDGEGAPVDPIDPDVLWSALRGELEPVPTREALMKTLSSSQGHEEVRLFLALDEELAQQVPGPAPAATSSATSVVRVVFGAAALAAAAAALLWVLRPPPPPIPEAGTIRAPAEAAVQSELNGAGLPRDAFELRWAPVGPGCTYDVRASTAAGVLVTEVTGLTASSLVLPAASLPTTGKILWQVDFVCEQRSGQSRTFSTSVTP